MKKLFLFCLFAAVSATVSCSKEDDGGDSGSKNTSAKIVRQIRISDGDYQNTLDFEYDSQNRIVAFFDEGYETSFFYSGNTVTVTTGYSSQILSLNSDGYITRIEYDDDEYVTTHTYDKGYLSQCNDYGSIYTYTWQDGNISAIKKPDWTSRFKYDSQKTSPINIDLFYLICYDYEIMYSYDALAYGLCGFYGKPTKNLPIQFSVYEDNETYNCTYQFNADGTVSKMSILDGNTVIYSFDIIYQ